MRKFLKDLGLKFYRVRAIPVPPKKTLAEHVADQAAFLETKLKPVLAAAQAGEGHVFFVDAAHFVFGTFLCYLWSFTRIFVRAASGRQRFNVLGAWNAVTRHLIAVTNTTVVNTETMSELLRKIAALGLTGAITLVLDNARYQHNAAVKALASQLGITLLFLPSYSPNLNLIERLWKFTKRRALYGRYHPKFALIFRLVSMTLGDPNRCPSPEVFVTARHLLDVGLNVGINPGGGPGQGADQQGLLVPVLFSLKKEPAPIIGSPSCTIDLRLPTAVDSTHPGIEL